MNIDIEALRYQGMLRYRRSKSYSDKILHLDMEVSVISKFEVSLIIDSFGPGSCRVARRISRQQFGIGATGHKLQCGYFIAAQFQVQQLKS